MKNKKRENINLFFSAFLITGYLVCTYFFLSLTAQTSMTVGAIISIAVFFVFGLLVFYATRVGDGTPIKRFSPIVLVILDLPALYIVLATFVEAFPLHDALNQQNLVMVLACIVLGYGIPYTFLSGFEMKPDEEISDAPIEGGIEEELGETDEEPTVEDEIEQLDTTDDVLDSEADDADDKQNSTQDEIAGE